MKNMTGSDHDLDKRGLGYLVSASLSASFLEHITPLTDAARESCGHDVFIPDIHQVHITLCHIMNLLQTYTVTERKEIMQRLPHYGKVLRDILREYRSIDVQFERAQIFPSCIIVSGRDSGEFDAIRKEFLSRVSLVGATKLPPSIIHSTIVTFRRPVDRDLVETYMKKVSFPFTERIRSFCLTKQTQHRKQEDTLLETYPLEGESSMVL